MTTEIEKLRKSFDPFPLDSMLVAINRICVEWANGQSVVKLPLLQDFPAKHPVLYWAAAETARHAIAWCSTRAKDSPIQLRRAVVATTDLEKLMSLVTDVQLNLPFMGSEETVTHLRSHSVLDVGCRLWLPQYLIQRQSSLRIGQAIMMYKQAPERRKRRDRNFPINRFNEILQSVLGCDLSSFVLALLQLRGISSGDNPCISAERTVPMTDRRYDDHFYYEAVGLIHPSVWCVANLLGAFASEIVREMRVDLDTYDDSAIVNAPNPLLKHPLLRPFSDRPDCLIAPVPHLVEEWLYEPLQDKLFMRCDSTFTVQHLAFIFEEYVGLLADKCSPDNESWIPESTLKEGYQGPVVDWAKDIGNLVVLIDAKRVFQDNLRRYHSHASDWERVETTWLEGVEQATKFWQNVKNGRVAALSDSRGKPAIALIVTHNDSDYRALHQDSRQKIESLISVETSSRIPWLILSIDRYEQIFTQWQSHGENHWFADILLKAAFEDTRQVLDEIPHTPSGPLWSELEELISSLQAKIEESAPYQNQ